MKLVKTASGKTTIKMSRKEWTSIGKKAGWPFSEEDTKNKFNEQKYKRGSLRSKAADFFVRTKPLMDNPDAIRNLLKLNPEDQPNVPALKFISDFCYSLQKYHGVLYSPDSTFEFRPVNMGEIGSCIYSCEEVIKGNKDYYEECISDVNQIIKLSKHILDNIGNQSPLFGIKYQ